MITINSTSAKKLMLKADYDSVYTSEVKSNGGNSGKINCKKEFLGKDVLVFVLKGGKKKKKWPQIY